MIAQVSVCTMCPTGKYYPKSTKLCHSSAKRYCTQGFTLINDTFWCSRTTTIQLYDNLFLDAESGGLDTFDGDTNSGVVLKDTYYLLKIIAYCNEHPNDCNEARLARIFYKVEGKRSDYKPNVKTVKGQRFSETEEEPRSKREARERKKRRRVRRSSSLLFLIFTQVSDQKPPPPSFYNNNPRRGDI